MKRNCNYAYLAFGLLLGMLYVYHSCNSRSGNSHWGEAQSAEPTSGPELALGAKNPSGDSLRSSQSNSMGNSKVTPTHMKRQIREFQRAQENELLAQRRKNSSDLKTLRSSQSLDMKNWENHERDGRHLFFSEHKSGPDRRNYIQDYKKRRDAYILNQTEQETNQKKEHDALLETLRQDHAARLKQFRDDLNRGVDPPSGLWPSKSSSNDSFSGNSEITSAHGGVFSEMIKVSRIIAGLSLFAAALVSTSAMAYFGGRVTVPSADMKQSPDDNAPTVQTLPQGTAFNAADSGRNGFYYIRTSSGQGWVRAESIGKGAGGSAPMASNAMAAPTDGRRKKRYSPYAPKAPDKHTWGIKVFYDLDLYSASALNAAAGTTQFSDGAGPGAEIEYFIKPKTALVLRLEDISKSVSGTDASGDTLTFSLSSFVVSPGVEFLLGEGPNAYFSFDMYLSYAPTSLSLAVTGANTGNGTFSSSGIGFLGKLEAGWKIGSSFNLYGDLGYRYLNLNNVQPGNVQNATSSTFFGQPVTINLSGPILGIGIGLRF